MNIDTSSALFAAGVAKADALKNVDKKDKELKKSTDAFEALVLKQMLEVAMDSKETIFPKQPGDQIYKSMYLDTLSNKLAGSFGYSELLYNYLKSGR